MKIQGRWRRVEVEKEIGLVPTPASLAAYAEATKPQPVSLSANDYMQTICTLRHRKGFTWQEIADWLTEHGLEYTMQSVRSAHCKSSCEDAS